ncbi:MAG UNVERIFIED_CONTAM: hypothetical protein LVR29_31485 [Microcystis novacekii LVE1205-3]|jgi:hypothetical protein
MSACQSPFLNGIPLLYPHHIQKPPLTLSLPILITAKGQETAKVPAKLPYQLGESVMPKSA